jgi:mannose PTS system EIID component
MNEGASGGLRRRDLARVSSRALYLQTLFTAQRMQGPGFAFALLPALRRLHRGPWELGRALGRHLGYFNTHPSLAGYALGAAARLEEWRLEGRPVEEADIEAMKRGLASPLAALGDPLFWVTLRPLAGLVGVLGLALLPGAGAGDADLRVLFCPLLVLLTYNAVALPFRFAGVGRGYALADRPAELVRSLRLSDWREALERAGAFGYGALAALAVTGIERSAARLGAPPAARVFVLVPLLLGAAAALVMHRRWPGRAAEAALGIFVLAALLAVRLG